MMNLVLLMICNKSKQNGMCKLAIVFSVLQYYVYFRYNKYHEGAD